MFAHLSLRASALRGRRIVHGLTRLLPAPPCLLLLASCAGAPPAPVSGVHAANPDSGARPATYRSVVETLCELASARSGWLARKQ